MISDKKNRYTNFENIFPHFMETVDDLIIIASLDNSHKIEYIHNCKYLEQLGYSDGSLLGKSLFNLVDFGEITPETDLKRMIQKNRNNKEIKVINKNGTLTWAELNSTLFNDERNKQKLLLKLRDISKTKELEIKLEESEKNLEKITKMIPEVGFWETFTPMKYGKALKESEALLKTAIECLPFDVFMINKNGHYIMQNSACKDHWGDVVGKRPEDVTNDQDTLEVWKNNNSRAFSGETVTGNVTFEIDGEHRYFYNIINPVYLDDEIEFIIGVNIDTTERKIAEQNLKESEDKFRTIAEQSLMGICIIQDFDIKYLNQQMAEIYGYPIEEIRQWKPKEFLKVVHPDSKQMVLNQLTKKQQGSEDTIIHYIAKIIKKNGNIRYVENYSRPITFQGRPADLHTQIDITAKRNAEHKLRSSEEKYRHLYENSPNAILLFNMRGEIIDCNLISEESSGFKRDELIGMSFQNINFIPKTFLPILLKDFKSVLKGKSMEPREIQLYTKDRSLVWVNCQASLFDYENEKIIQVIIQVIDEKKKAEEKLRASEEKYRSLFENSPIALMIQDFSKMKKYVDHLRASGINDFEKFFHDKPGEILKFMTKAKVIDVNSKALEVYKCNSKEDFIRKMNQLGESMDNIVTEEVFLDNKMELLSIINGDSMYESEIVSKTFTGDTIYLYAKTSMVPGFENTWSKVIVSIVNITDRRLTEQKLKESEEKYRSLFENMNAGFAYHKVLVDDNNKPVDYKYLEVNPAFERLTGMKREDLIGRTVTEAIPGTENDPADWIGRFGIVGLTGKPLTVEDYSEAIDKWFKVAGYSPKKGYFAVTFTDITDRKQAEEKLKDSEAKYHELFETSPDGVILTDLKGIIVECNSAIEQISGYSPGEFIGKNFITLDIYHEEGLEKLLEGYRDLLEENQIEAVEFPIKRKDNQINWVQVRSTLINMKGQTYILAVIHDVTTQKQAENAIKTSEQKYRDLLESSSVGVIEIDVINNQIIYMNPKLVEIIGYKGEELTEDHFLNKLIHPKDLRKLLDSNEESELEFRIYDKIGKLKWLSGKRIPHHDDNGQIISIRVWLEDITEKKMYENLIYELNVNFLNFTADIKNNIQLLLSTCLNLLNGDFILYINKTAHEGQETYQVLTSDNKSFMCDSEFFADNLFVSALFYESHDFPQTFFDINRMSFANTDPFIARYNLKGCFGKLIKSQNDLESAVCVFYKQNPVISNQDKLVMFLICDAIEIEQRRWQVQRGLEEQNITLNKINNLKTELFSRTSHELKTPLISIKGFTELLLTLHKPKLDNDVISILQEIKDGSKRLEKIINLLLESTKLEAGQLELNSSNEDLSFLINFCVNELKGLAKLRNQCITLKLHDILETEFDKERIYEVFSNLLVNAIKYTPPGGNITIESKIEDSFYLISVKDNGIGFTAEEKNQAFKQFGKIERYGQGWDVAIEGTGLGLYITKKLVELHGGKIWLDSKGRNKGSCFYFTIPIKKN